MVIPKTRRSIVPTNIPKRLKPEIKIKRTPIILKINLGIRPRRRSKNEKKRLILFFRVEEAFS